VKRKFLKPEKVLCFCLFLCLIVSCSLGYAAAENASAKDILQEFNKNKITKAYAHYTMGILYDNIEDLRSATDEYKKALEYDPSSSAIYLRLSFDYIKLGQYESAIKQLNSAMKASNEDAGHRFLLAFLYATRSKFDDAASEYKKILASDPQDLNALSSLADIYVLQGRLKEALSIYIKLTKYEELTPIVFFNMGILYSKLNNFKAAEYCLKKAIYLYPDDHEALNYLGYMYAQRGEHLDEAISLIKKALEFEPENGAYMDSLGWAYFKKGMLKEALFNLEKAQEVMPDPQIEGHLKEVKEKLKR
jgi:tetratricopeptide (TPR) repeat protein